MSLRLPATVEASAGAGSIATAVYRLDAWLRTMRAPQGYAGPISHWWESCLVYCGPMIDWRYEGVLCAYATLLAVTDDPRWLAHARQAADDVVQSQLPNGSYRNSSFQYGPIEGGTPHEAAVNVGMLELAKVLRERGDGHWQHYVEVAERNIYGYLLQSLWGGRGFKEQPWDDTLVPNKNATALEALLLYGELTGRDMSEWVEPAVRVILEAQERAGPRAGGTVHTGTHKHRLAIGIYTARSMCGVLRWYQHCGDPALLDAVGHAMQFLNRQITERGVVFGQYHDGSMIANPCWIAPAGDLLRAAVLGERYSLTPPGMRERLVQLLVGQQLPSGALPTAYGFAKRGGRFPHAGLPEFRDVLPAVGWCDKALRALALLMPSDASEQVATNDTKLACTWKGRRCWYEETAHEIRLHDQQNGHELFRWCKGHTWPSVYAL